MPLPIKLLALDLDGTLLHTDKTLSARTLRTLAACRAKGVRIAVATARSETAAQRFLDALQPDYIVANGGATARAAGQSAPFYRSALPAETANAILRAVYGHPACKNITAETDRGYLVAHKTDETGEYGNALLWDFSAPLPGLAYEVTVELTDPALAARIAAEHPDCTVTGFAGEDWYRYASRSANKLAAVQAVADAAGVPLAQTAAFGDDWMDLELLRGCGVGVAVANALPQVQAAAAFVCPANDADGVAAWLEEYLL